MTIKFVKVCGFWFVDIPCEIGRVLEMQMVDGADKLLDEILHIEENDCQAYVEITYDDEPDIILEKTESDEIGASYFVNSKIDGITTKTIWLCNVCIEVLGEHPNSIPIKIIK